MENKTRSPKIAPLPASSSADIQTGMSHRGNRKHKKIPMQPKPRGGVAGAVPRTGGRRVSGVAFLLASLFVYDEYAMPARLFTRGTRVQYAAPDSAVGGIRPLTMDPNHLAMAAPPASTASPIRTSTCSLVKLTLALRSDFADEILMEEERKPSPMASS